MWTSSNTKRGFMAITAHYIDGSWILQSQILRFIYVPTSHTKEVLSDMLLSSLMDWNIDRKISMITLYNCSTNDGMIVCLLEKLNASDLLIDGLVLQMRCAAHILNLIVKDGLEMMSGTIERIRDSVVYWTTSAARIENFEEVARQLRISPTKKLSLDCKIRWNSTFLMLQKASIYKDVFPRVKVREKYYTSLPNDDDWVVCNAICEKLKLFYQVTKMFSGTRYPTLNEFFAKVCHIKVSLAQWMKSQNCLIRVIAEKMMRKYQKNWEDCNVILGIAAVLDPRYKMKLIEYYFPVIYGDESFMKIEAICQNCFSLLHDYEYRSSLGGNRVDSQCMASHSEHVSGSHDKNEVETDHLADFDKFVAFNSSDVTSKLELDFYPEENVFPRVPTFEIFATYSTSEGISCNTLFDEEDDVNCVTE
ncbi:zinc finger BED domain-containing protein RICESLEEPER 1-like [Coffea arabica]|uniref:Zinc finger BED domain-containing protein RICESLEEPER 1-like n=1 Tax=Coffea arabica TaxID=13443 RepID=A0ABM4UEH8_COFAR